MVARPHASDEQQAPLPLKVLRMRDRINLDRRDRRRCRHDPSATPTTATAWNSCPFIPCIVRTRTAFLFDLLPSGNEGPLPDPAPLSPV
jgi:hypothetical protein